MEIKKTLHEVGTGVFAYTQLPGSWGWRNDRLIVDGDQSLLVDTLFDRRITREMLASGSTAGYWPRSARRRASCAAGGRPGASPTSISGVWSASGTATT